MSLSRESTRFPPRPKGRGFQREDMMKLKLAGAAILYSLVAVGATPDTNPTLKLADAITIGLSNATSVLRAESRSVYSGTQLLQSYLQFLPNLTGSATYGNYFGTTYTFVPKPQKTVASSQGGSFQLSSSINLFNGFNDIHALKAAIARKSAAALSYERAKQQIVIDITQSYMQVILDQRLLEIAQKSLDASKQRETLLIEQAKLGVKDIANLYTQQAQTASDEAAVVSATTRLETDIVHLLQRLRTPDAKYHFLDPAIASDPLPGDAQSDAELIKIALEKRQDFKAASETSKAAEFATEQAASTYYPRLDFSLNMYGLTRTLKSQSINGTDQGPFIQEPFDKQIRDNDNYSVLLSLSWNIFDRGVTKAAVERAAYDAASSRYDFEDLRMQVVTEVRQAKADFQGAKSRWSAAKRGVLAAEKSYERIDARYKEGAATFLDLLTAQVALAQARNAEAQARVDTSLQTLIIAHVLGETRVPHS